MDIWFTVLNSRLESSEFEFEKDFIGGKIIIKKDYIEEESAEWLVHVYFIPVEFRERPLIGDLCIRHGKLRREVRAGLWFNETFVGHAITKEKEGRLQVAARIRRMLFLTDLKEPSSSRSFVVQNFDNCLRKQVLHHVDVIRLNLIAGGDLFQKWRVQHDAGVSTFVEPLEPKLLEALFEATARYDDLVVLRHILEELLTVARRFRMTRLMRAIEEYYLESPSFNWEEKLLIATQYRMSRLYIQVQRSFLVAPWTNLCRIQRALINQKTVASRFGDDPGLDLYSNMHKNIRQLIFLSEENICIEGIGIRANCSICLALLTGSGSISALPCGHTFHFVCVIKWLEAKKECPNCRRSVNRQKIIEKLFFEEILAANVGCSTVDFSEKAEALALELQRERENSSAALLKVEEHEKEKKKLLSKITKLELKISKEIPRLISRNQQLELIADDRQNLEKDYHKTKALLRASHFYKLLTTATVDDVEASLSKYISANGDVDAGKFTVLLRRQIDDLKRKAKSTQQEIQHHEQKVRRIKKEKEEKEEIINDLKREVQRLREDFNAETPMNKRLRAVLAEPTPRRPSLGFDRTFGQREKENFLPKSLSVNSVLNNGSQEYDEEEEEDVFAARPCSSKRKSPISTAPHELDAIVVANKDDSTFDFSFDISVPKALLARVCTKNHAVTSESQKKSSGFHKSTSSSNFPARLADIPDESTKELRPVALTQRSERKRGGNSKEKIVPKKVARISTFRGHKTGGRHNYFIDSLLHTTILSLSIPAVPMIDVHCHLADNKFKEDVDEVIQRAKEAGVQGVVVVPEFVNQFKRVLEIAERYPRFAFCAFGVHPIQKRNRGVRLDAIVEVERHLQEHHDKAICVGEIGLDHTTSQFKLTADGLKTQEEVFRRQIRLALKFDLPINVHSRSAARRTTEVLREERFPGNKVVLHAYDGTIEDAQQAVADGAFLSVPPCFASCENARKVFETVPMSHILLETDSPALGPRKGERNEPANLRFSAQFVSEIKKIELEEVIQATSNNANRLLCFKQSTLSE
ncbi:unnamed protein product [Caenorhabditis auriculariae]|uniref:RING-type domain-containing protein n=1 Tax=Caenorhabditis auriculariae TaxID=2777116 RepID=A0A8S1HC62_9PELO|nr:unnamed protein product [Caenorhabditis auriculariae]